MATLRRVNQYRFKWPCFVCNQRLPLCDHYKHFKTNHLNIDLKKSCYLCLEYFNSRSALLHHHRVCADYIYRTKPGNREHGGRLVLRGSGLQNTPHRRYVEPGEPAADSPLHLLDSLPPFPVRYQFEPKIVPLKIQCIRRNKDRVRPLTIDETRLNPLLQWILEGNSQVYDDEVKLILAILQDEDHWYHVVLSKYHFESFARYATAQIAQVTRIKCLCSAGKEEVDDRTLHAHLLVKVPNIRKFKRLCWNKLRSPDAKKHKKLIEIKSRHHLFNTIFYASQVRACSTTKSNKHHDIQVVLTPVHASLVLLIFRVLLYNCKIEFRRSKLALSLFDITSFEDHEGERVFASSAENVFSVMDFMNQRVFSKFRLVATQEPGPMTLTHSRSGYVDLKACTESTITVHDVLRETDGLDYSMIWTKDKVKHIKDILYFKNQKQDRGILVVCIDDTTVACFGDKRRAAFRLPEDEATAKFQVARYAVGTTVIAANWQQAQRLEPFVGNCVVQINTHIVNNLVIEAEQRAEHIYETHPIIP